MIKHNPLSMFETFLEIQQNHIFNVIGGRFSGINILIIYIASINTMNSNIAKFSKLSLGAIIGLGISMGMVLSSSFYSTLSYSIYFLL